MLILFKCPANQKFGAVTIFWAATFCMTWISWEARRLHTAHAFWELERRSPFKQYFQFWDLERGSPFKQYFQFQLSESLICGCLDCCAWPWWATPPASGATPAPPPLRTGSPRWFFSLYDNCNDSSSAFLAVNWMNLLSAGWKSDTSSSQETRTQEGLCKDHDTVGPIVNCTDPRWEI